MDTMDVRLNVRPIRVGGLLLPSNVLMAPLAGYTCYPFRMLAYELGAGLCFTEMCSANALKYEDRATNRLLITTPEEPVKAVQLLGGNPAVMERMAKALFWKRLISLTSIWAVRCRMCLRAVRAVR